MARDALQLTITAESRPRSVEFYQLSKEGKERYVSRASLVDAVDPYTLTAADLVADIESLQPLT